jgi:hypothetical protein
MDKRHSKEERKILKPILAKKEKNDRLGVFEG